MSTLLLKLSGFCGIWYRALSHCDSNLNQHLKEHKQQVLFFFFVEKKIRRHLAENTVKVKSTADQQLVHGFLTSGVGSTELQQQHLAYVGTEICGRLRRYL